MRHRVKKRVDRKIFKKTASRAPKTNFISYRGGIRL